QVPHVLVVRKDLAVMDVAELVALAKSKPGGLTCGSTGVGSASHLTMELFKTRADVAMLHVPFRGSAPLITELLARCFAVSLPARRSADAACREVTRGTGRPDAGCNRHMGRRHQGGERPT